MRIVFAAFIALGLAACSDPYRSAVDLAPISLRAAASPVADGLYCLAVISWRADGEPVAAMSGDRHSCVHYRWDAGRRVAVGESFDSKDGDRAEREESAMVALGDGVFLAQAAEPSTQSEAPYSVTLAVIADDAIAAVSPLEDTTRRELAKRFPAVVLGDRDEQDGSSYIKSGDLTAIHAYLKDAARLGLARPDEEGNFSLQMMLRVAAPTQDTVFSLLRRPDVAALKSRVQALASSAPKDIEPGSAQWSSPFPLGH